MRFHTAPLIAFTAYLEKKRLTAGTDNSKFHPGQQFSCYVKSVKVHKTNNYENVTKYRSYSRLTFTYTHSGYDFKLDPGGFLSLSPRGEVRFRGGNRYEIVRYGDWKESFVIFNFDMPAARIRGAYNNWHLETSSFGGKVDGNKVEISAHGPHYKRDSSSPYYRLTERDRMTVWVFEVEFAHVSPTDL